MTADRDLIHTATQAGCTPLQLEALELYHRGYGYRRIARQLGISPQAVQARLEGADRAIARYRKDNAA